MARSRKERPPSGRDYGRRPTTSATFAPAARRLPAFVFCASTRPGLPRFFVTLPMAQCALLSAALAPLSALPLSFGTTQVAGLGCTSGVSPPVGVCGCCTALPGCCWLPGEPSPEAVLGSETGSGAG